MRAKFFDHQDTENEKNERDVVDAGEALALLRSLRSRQPSFCSLESRSWTLLIGVAEEMGCVQLSAPDRQPPYLMAFNSSNVNADGYVEFMSGGTPTPISVRYCIPWELVEEIVKELLTHDRQPAGIVWEEI